MSLLVLTSSLVAMPALAAGSATLSLFPTATSVGSDQAFVVTVLLEPNGESLDTARVHLQFDPEQLEAHWFDLGDVFPFLTPGYWINNEAGTVSFGGSVFNKLVTEGGPVGTVRFRAKTGAESRIELTGESKLILDGVEKLDISKLGSVVVNSGSEATAPAPKDPELERQALVYFGAFAGHLPETAVDWEALHCIAYDDCLPPERDVAKEGKALEVFGAKYARLPSSRLDWNTVHAIAYTTVYYNWESM